MNVYLRRGGACLFALKEKLQPLGFTNIGREEETASLRVFFSRE